ncbi:MAG: Fe(3+) dicitrate transport protein, partial [Myxococcota bacterium]
KGPAAIQFGPQTIGGAINFHSREVPDYGHVAFGDLAYGMYHYNKAHGYYGFGAEHWGILAEAVHLMSDGFKELTDGDSGGTGFNKQEFILKARFNTDPLGDVFHRWDVRFGFSRENSNETYVGLTDSDFDENPDRRYPSTALDQLDLMRFSAAVGYTVQAGDDVDFRIRLYRNDMERSWQKLDSIKGAGATIAQILADPITHKTSYDELTGAEENGQPLLIRTNARTYVSQGVDADFVFRAQTGPVAHDVHVGARFHYDEIVRDHTEDEYNIAKGGTLSEAGTPTATVTKNEGSAHALATFAQYAVSGWNLTLKPGIRVEQIWTDQVTVTDHLSAGNVAGATVNDGSKSQTVILGGIGIHYEIIEGLGVLAGVYQGFSPVSPGQSLDVDPEKSINYEVGLRYARPSTKTLLEGVFFFTDYSNLVSTCSASNGCTGTIDSQQNVGDVDVFGVEVVLAHEFKLPAELRLPVRATYTFSKGTFSGDVNNNPEFGDANAGDDLPHLPSHQASLTLGLSAPVWGVNLQATYLDATRETPGSGDPADDEVTGRALVLDVGAHYRPLPWLTVYLKGENLVTTRPIISRRPYGARPGKPFLVSGGLKMQL